MAVHDKQVHSIKEMKMHKEFNETKSFGYNITQLSVCVIITVDHFVSPFNNFRHVMMTHVLFGCAGA